MNVPIIVERRKLQIFDKYTGLGYFFENFEYLGYVKIVDEVELPDH